jgi:hypothetical protein
MQQYLLKEREHTSFECVDPTGLASLTIDDYRQLDPPDMNDRLTNTHHRSLQLRWGHALQHTFS